MARPQARRPAAAAGAAVAMQPIQVAAAVAAVAAGREIAQPVPLRRSIAVSYSLNATPDTSTAAAGSGATFAELRDISSDMAALGLQERHTPARFVYESRQTGQASGDEEETITFEVLPDEGHPD